MVNEKPIPVATARRLKQLLDAAEEAQEAYRAGVADALKHGAGVRAISRLTGLSTNTVALWGAQRGWPTPAQQREKAELKANKARWDSFFAGTVEDS